MGRAKLTMELIKREKLITKYKGQPTDERKKKTSLLFNFFEDRNKKAQDALTKLRKSNGQAKYPSWDERFDNFSEEKLNKIASLLEKKLGNAKKFKVMNENKSNYYVYHLQEQQKMLTRKRSMEFEESRQPNKFHITSNSRQPIFNSYNSQFPMPMHMQIPMPVPLQQYSVGSMAQRYTDGSMQPMPQNYVENPVWNTAAASSQMLAFSPCQKDDQNGYN
ncbi:hypothetical protein POM88_043104 [Heracleum sosnowskyi]|uniref:Uncharacterized protein n=1 Tax=Heracleum sosnowskyi TaxID=360622 RepID=A0AAD8H2V1_9APIA|nr:hypothetical protein POM88_043104 [Heracleum sosnowskyi]